MAKSDIDALLLAISSPAFACSFDGQTLKMVLQNEAAQLVDDIEGALDLVDSRKSAQEIEYAGQRILVQVRPPRRPSSAHRHSHRSSQSRQQSSGSTVHSPLSENSPVSAPVESVMPTDQRLGSTSETRGQTGDEIERTVWQTLLEAVPACALVLDRDGRPLFVSKTDFETFKSCPEDGWPDKTVLPGHLRALHSDGTFYEREDYPLHRCLRSHEVVRGEMLSYASNEDGTVHLRYTATPIFRAEDGSLLAVTAIIENVTQSELDHAELLRLKADQTANERINVLKDQFIGMISHELRTPLNGIVGLVELLDSSTDELDRQALLTDIRHSSDSLAWVINDLLTLQAISSAQPQALSQACHLQQLIASIIKTQIERRPVGSNVRIEDKFSEGLRDKHIMCDRARIKVALGHILNNAVRFSEPDGVVTVNAWTACAEALELEEIPVSDKYVVMEVGDAGKGMDVETVRQVFEPFFQADSSRKRPRNGAGVGATVAKAMLIAHKGDIRIIRSEPSQGTLIQLYLPLKDVPASFVSPGEGDSTAIEANGASLTFSGANRDPTPTSSSPIASGGLHILAVDDERINLLVMKRALEREGFTVTTACNGLEAVDKFRSAASTVNLVLLDIMMPVLSGIDAGAQLRALPNGADVPIIAFTATSGMETLAECQRLSMKIVHKPCPPKDLLAIVREML